MKKLLSIMLSVLLCLGVFTSIGCSGGGGDTLLIWSFTDEVEKMVENYYYRDNGTSTKITVMNYEVNDLATKIDNAMKAPKNLPDMIAIEEKYMGRYIDTGLFLELDDMLDEATDMYDYTINAATNSDGNVIAYAWQATPGALYYRTDMAESILGVTTPEQMQAKVSDWTKFVATAKEIADKTAGTNQTGYSDVKMLSDVGAVSKVFYSNRTKGWVENDELQIEEFLYNGEESMYEIVKDLQVGNGTWGSVEKPFVNETMNRSTAWYADMSGDKVFSYILPSYSLQYDLKANCENKTNGTTTEGKWGVVAGPQAYSDGGTWLGVVSTSAKTEKAKEIIRYFTMDQTFLQSWAEDTGEFVNSKSLMAEYANDPDKAEDFLGGQNHYELFAEIADNISGNKLTPYDAKLNSMFEEWAVNYAKIENVLQDSAKLDALTGFIDGVSGAYRLVDTTNVNIVIR